MVTTADADTARTMPATVVRGASFLFFLYFNTTYLFLAPATMLASLFTIAHSGNYLTASPTTDLLPRSRRGGIPFLCLTPRLIRGVGSITLGSSTTNSFFVSSAFMPRGSRGLARFSGSLLRFKRFVVVFGSLFLCSVGIWRGWVLAQWSLGVGVFGGLLDNGTDLYGACKFVF